MAWANWMPEAPAAASGKKSSAVKGVKLTIGDGSVIVDLQITVKYGRCADPAGGAECAGSGHERSGIHDGA